MIYKDEINRYWSIKEFNAFDLEKRESVLYAINQHLEVLKTEDRIIWAKKYLPKQSVLSSSFGIQSSVSLHLITRFYPEIPIILIDTGYLFPETYRFIDQLKRKMKLNLHVFQPSHSAAWQEARYGKLWEHGISGIRKYNFINKIKPMRSALKILNANIWFAGLRRIQSDTRRNLSVISIQNRVFKFLPIIDWSDDQVDWYINRYNLEYHPLRNQGYVSVGDIHTTKKLETGMKDEETRFFGLQRECGLHFVD